MPRVCCLAGIDEDKLALFASVLGNAGIVAPTTIERFNVSALGKLRPSLILCDVDRLDVDPLEMLRRLRFVLPDCIIAVYTGVATREWALVCHLAGANCLLSKSSTPTQLTIGVRDVLLNGCYTDPRCAAA